MHVAASADTAWLRSATVGAGFSGDWGGLGGLRCRMWLLECAFGQYIPALGKYVSALVRDGVGVLHCGDRKAYMCMHFSPDLTVIVSETWPAAC